MARESMIELSCTGEGKDIAYIIDLLCKAGWNVTDDNGFIKYLPAGDDEDYCWEKDKISFEELRRIIMLKQQENEVIGVCLFYKDTLCGVDLLARDVGNIIISININRKTVDEQRDALTDFGWYFSKLILPLYEDSSITLSYKYEEYFD